MQAKTPPERLELLLPWLNLAPSGGGDFPRSPVRRWLYDFLQSFDGSKDAGFIRQVYDGTREPDGCNFFPDTKHWPPVSEAEFDELLKLRWDLVDMLDAGFGAKHRGRERWWDPDEFETLWFSVEGRRAAADKLPTNISERRDYMAAGAYVLLVNGSLRDLVRFLVGFLLTQPGMVTMTRCPAPKAGDWSQTCDRFVIRTTGLGRPRTFCSDACRERVWAKQKGERHKRRA